MGAGRGRAPQDAALLDRSCAGAGLEESWDALFAMAELFERAALAGAADLGYAYPEEVARGTRAYLERLRRRSP